MSDSSEPGAVLRRAVLSLPTVSDAVLLVDELGRETVVAEGFITGPQVRAAASAAGLRPPDCVVIVRAMPPWEQSVPDAVEQLARLRSSPSVVVYDFAAPVGPLEEALCAIWREVLRLAEVGAQDDLLDLGGDSLTGIEIATRIEERFGLECDLDMVFQAGTVRALAVELEQSAVRHGEST